MWLIASTFGDLFQREFFGGRVGRDVSPAGLSGARRRLDRRQFRDLIRGGRTPARSGTASEQETGREHQEESDGPGKNFFHGLMHVGIRQQRVIG